ncbi:aminotransferase class I/II-fold pyridoxal phosphate-dependent enzyme [Balneolaceae bacterium YR4-1]|uniref:Aminotransferase class I/II-fold pyridoxal phosphate-dependent enzyme n=1 Tax=Halalkalibaculum roseum TaxID=2709311 RepID=A0A6M1SVL3_9BACT|nr:GntG family PLP-dependent aldolase [Halalkalibaculum roseum]NGP76902.1 aminotransferase class I/II-fold pyridoxal phosphate-dependent enzyme [Halalkalibaculum roseum]
MIDLRSDTVTKPTEEMRKAMVQAEVGDDVFGEDPTVNRLQEKVSSMFGMESGLFVPSGVMSNQLALKLLCSAGDEVLIDYKGHIFNYETAAASLISSVQLNPLRGTKGKLTPDLIKEAMRSGQDWEPKPSVIVLENATNKGGGTCYSESDLRVMSNTAKELGLSVHLDGARLWNAMTATQTAPEFYGTVADTITVSFSKGLGAPVGSMLLSSRKRIDKARRFRKMLGGGMRQVGMLAAAADYAIKHHLPLLKEDHRRAKELAYTISNCRKLAIDPDTVETNIVIFEVNSGEVDSTLKLLEKKGIHMVPFGSNTIRATFHFEIGDSELKMVSEAMEALFD